MVASEAHAKARLNICYLQMWMAKACGASVHKVHKQRSLYCLKPKFLLISESSVLCLSWKCCQVAVQWWTLKFRGPVNKSQRNPGSLTNASGLNIDVVREFLFQQTTTHVMKLNHFIGNWRAWFLFLTIGTGSVAVCNLMSVHGALAPSADELEKFPSSAACHCCESLFMTQTQAESKSDAWQLWDWLPLVS